MEYTIIGVGVLNWGKSERVSDRYGYVHLDIPGTDDLDILDKSKVEEKGRLVAVVKETRQSSHIGDLFRGIFPETPEVGEEIELGNGELSFMDRGYGDEVGLIPTDGRDNDWLDPKALYRCHEQTVELRFYPA